MLTDMIIDDLMILLILWESFIVELVILLVHWESDIAQLVILLIHWEFVIVELVILLIYTVKVSYSWISDVTHIHVCVSRRVSHRWVNDIAYLRRVSHKWVSQEICPICLQNWHAACIRKSWTGHHPPNLPASRNPGMTARTAATGDIFIPQSLCNDIQPMILYRAFMSCFTVSDVINA